MHRFLIDECLSPELATEAKARGFHALHVNWANMSGYRDEVVAVYAMGGDYIFVTNNGVDFRPIYRLLEMHVGLVVIIPSLKKPGQLRLFNQIMDRLESERDIVNKLVEIDETGVITIADWPPLLSNTAEI